MIKLILSDIDGTLVGHGSQTIHENVFAEIRRLKDKGILFCPASGRTYSNLRRLFAPIAGNICYICENGAILFGEGMQGRVIAKKPMDRELCRELYSDILALDDTEAMLSGEDVNYIVPRTGYFKEMVGTFVEDRIECIGSFNEMPEDILKVSVFSRHGLEQTLAVECSLRDKWTKHFHCAVSGDRWLDFTLADKGTGVEALCRSLNIDPADVMAFGDNYNDIPMLSLVGHPFIMQSAPAELLQRFPNRCGSVLEILQKL